MARQPHPDIAPPKRTNDWESTAGISIHYQRAVSRLEYKYAKYNNNYCRINNDPSLSLRNPGTFYTPGYRQSTMWNYGFLASNNESAAIKERYCNILADMAPRIDIKIKGDTVDYKTTRAVRHAQYYLDEVNKLWDVKKEILKAHSSAFTFDIGYVFVNPICPRISCIQAFNATFLKEECQIGTPRRMLLRFFNVSPVSYAEFGVEATLDELENYWFCNYLDVWFDTVARRVWVIVDGHVRMERAYWEELPAVPVYWRQPHLGDESISVIDDLKGKQDSLYYVSAAIDLAAKKGIKSFTFVRGSKLSLVTEEAILNRTGSVITYDGSDGTGIPVANFNPEFIHQSWTIYKQQLIDDMWQSHSMTRQIMNDIGKNQSGKGIVAAESIADDGLNILQESFKRSYNDAFNKLISVLRGLEKIEGVSYGKIDWKTIVSLRDRMVIDFNTLSALSRDPYTRIQQLIGLFQKGLVVKSEIAEILDFPSVDRGLRRMAAEFNAMQEVIEDALDAEDGAELFVPPSVLPGRIIKESTIQQNMFIANGDYEAPKRLQRLIDVCNRIIDDTDPDESIFAASIRGTGAPGAPGEQPPQGVDATQEDATQNALG